jgi:hypothetical protein
MARNTKAISGPAKTKYFRSALRGQPGVTAAAAERLAQQFDDDVSQLRVRQHVALTKATSAERSAPTAPTPVTAAPAAPVPPIVAPAPATFDPHAFSLIVVMTKQGEAGLQARLETIASAEHLRALARAQHVAIDAALDQPAALRTAIIAGTAQRIADRRAAAS